MVMETQPSDNDNKNDKDQEQPDVNQAEAEQKEAGDKEQPKQGKEGSKEQAGGSKIDVDIGSSTGDVDISDIKNEYHYHSQQELGIEELAHKHFSIVDIATIDQSGLIVDESAVSKLRQSLEENRLLFVTGQPELGKATLVRSVALSLKDSISQVLTLRHVDSNVIINLGNIASASKFKNTLLIFKDVFVTKHNDLMNFFERLEKDQIASLVAKLKENHCYLVFTNDKLDGEQQRELDKVSAVGIEHPLLNLPVTKLIEGYKQQVARFVNLHFKDITAAEALFGVDQGYAEQLQTIPRMLRFIEAHGQRILENETTVELALKGFNDENLKQWFFHELAADFDSWCFALALILSYPSGHFLSSWLQFHQFYRVVHRFFEQELALELPKKKGNMQFLGDDILLLKSRAHVQSYNYPIADVIQFSDENYTEALWQVLLSDGHHVLSQLTPLLIELAMGDNYYHRLSATKALGRIGELDYHYIVRPLIWEWIRSSDFKHHQGIGFLFQGILNSKNKHYIDESISYLRSFHNKTNIQSLKIILPMIGRVSIECALTELKHILLGKLGETADELQSFNKALVEWQASIPAFMRSIDGHKQVLELITGEIFAQDKQKHAIKVVLSCVKELSYISDPVIVISHLLDWIKEAPTQLTAVMVILFLDIHGIADKLEHGALSQIDNENYKLKQSPILLAASRSESAQTILTEFLTTIYKGIKALPQPLQPGLEVRFYLLLQVWAKNKAIDKNLEPTIIQVLRSLCIFDSKQLKSAIKKMLFEAKLGLLAKDVLQPI
jgi:hypothetical protein